MNNDTKVDVRAVMRAGAKRLRLGVESPLTAGLLDQSCAALDELIEALPSLLGLYRLKWGNLDQDANNVYERAEAAIARIDGSAE